MLSSKQEAKQNPSYPALGRQDTTSPWSTDCGGNSYHRGEKIAKLIIF